MTRFSAIDLSNRSQNDESITEAKESTALMQPGTGRRPRAAVLGAAHWHAPLYVDALLRRFDVVAVQDADPTARNAYAAPFGVEPTADVDHAMDEDLDVAFVFTPHHEMAEVARKLVARGIPFIIEKPAGRNLTELRDVISAASRAGIPVAVPLVQRDAPIDRWLRQAGDITYERMAFVAGPPSRYERNGNAWMLDPELSGGGSLMNLGPHFIDMAIHHVGHPDHVHLHASSALHGGLVDDHATMILTTAEGREAIVEVGYAFPDSDLKRYCSFSATGTYGFATVDTLGAATFTDLAGRTTTETLIVDSDPLYGVFVDGVADTLTSGFEGLPTLEDLHATMKLIWASTSGGSVGHG